MGGRFYKSEGWASIYDGAKLGHNYPLNSNPVYVADNRLSLIETYGGKNHSFFFKITILNAILKKILDGACG